MKTGTEYLTVHDINMHRHLHRQLKRDLIILYDSCVILQYLNLKK